MSHVLRAAGSIGLLAMACAMPESPLSPGSPPGLEAAKGGGSGPTVSSTDPSFGKQGQRLNVRVLGSGFNSTAVAAWERGGAVDQEITVHSTFYQSSSELLADITVGLNATVALYDVAVTILVSGGSKKGVGTEKFEVTTANVLPELSGPGNVSHAWGINDAGQVVGMSHTWAFFWGPSSGLESLGTGQAFDLDPTGTIVVGTSNTGAPRWPMLWTGGAGNWTGVQLPTNCVNGTANGGSARAITSDGLLAGGTVTVQLPRNKTRNRPVVWNIQALSCTELAMPAGYTTYSRVTDVTPVGMAVGIAENAAGVYRAVVWSSSGTPTLLAPLPAAEVSAAQAISSDGTLVVGWSGPTAAYWIWTGSTWSSPVGLGCNGRANDISDAGLIVGLGCGGARYWQLAGGVVSASGGLPGLGSQGGGEAEAVTNNTVFGQPWVAGRSSDRAVYWDKP